MAREPQKRPFRGGGDPTHTREPKSTLAILFGFASVRLSFGGGDSYVRVRRSADRYPNRTAYIFEDERITFAEYNRRVNKAANTLTSLGLEKGQHIAILGQNSIRYLEACHAAAKLGLVFGTINWRLTPREIAFIVTDADNQVLLVEAELQSLVREILDQLSDVTVLVYGGEVELAGARSYDALFTAADDEEPDVEVNGNDPAVIMYTSGTTGLPKGAVLSHSNVVWDSVFALIYVPPQSGDCFLLSMPMSHVSGLHTQTTTFLESGLPVVVMRQWEPELACQLIEKHRVTIAYILVTPLIQLMETGAHKRYDLTALSRVMTAAAPSDRFNLLGHRNTSRGVGTWRVRGYASNPSNGPHDPARLRLRTSQYDCNDGDDRPDYCLRQFPRLFSDTYRGH